ncbi:MAG: hypothetical protein ACRBK7_24805 [Acidimicrobiales bacterium]
MALFAVTLTDQTTDVVEGADAYQQEGPMTTFFSFQENRQVIDSWSSRLASYRTSDITAIRRSAPPGLTPELEDAAITSQAMTAQTPELSVA